MERRTMRTLAVCQVCNLAPGIYVVWPGSLGHCIRCHALVRLLDEDHDEYPVPPLVAREWRDLMARYWRECGYPILHVALTEHPSHDGAAAERMEQWMRKQFPEAPVGDGNAYLVVGSNPFYAGGVAQFLGLPDDPGRGPEWRQGWTLAALDPNLGLLRGLILNGQVRVREIDSGERPAVEAQAVEDDEEVTPEMREAGAAAFDWRKPMESVRAMYRAMRAARPGRGTFTSIPVERSVAVCESCGARYPMVWSYPYHGEQIPPESQRTRGPALVDRRPCSDCDGPLRIVQEPMT